MRVERSERGLISLSGIIALAVLAALVFLALRLLPPYISNFQFEDSIKKIALTASYSPMTEDDILKEVISRADGFGIQLRPRQVTVHKGSKGVAIAVDYTAPVDLLVRQVDLHFALAAANRSIALPE